MLINEISLRAEMETIRQQKLLSWKFRENIFSFLAYLYWRNRFPLLTKIVSRLLIIIEIYLINHYYNFYVASSFGLVMFIFYYLKELQSGITQGLKKEILETKLRNNLQATNKALGNSILIGLIYGLICPIIFFVVSTLFPENLLLQFFIGIWAIVFPLQLISGNLWTILYGFQRLQRSFALIIFCRILPIVTLLLFAKQIGIYAYLAGFVIGRTTEFIYLTCLAFSALGKRGITPDFHIRKTITVLFKNNFPQIIFPLPFALYNCSLALMIFIRDQNEWLSYFFLIYLLNIIIYFAIRAPQSLVMDYYLSIINLNLKQAKRWLHKGQTTKNIVLILITIFIVALIIIQPVSFVPIVGLVKIAPFLTLLVLARSILTSKFFFIQGAFLERVYYRRLIISHVILVTIMALIIFKLRANLNMIYLTEGLGLILLGLSIKVDQRLEESAIYQFKKNFLLTKFKLIPAETIATLGNQQGHGFLLMQIDSEYDTPRKRELTLTRISQALNAKDILIPIYPNLYLILLSKKIDLQNIQSKLHLQFAGIIRNLVCIDPTISPLIVLMEIKLAIQKTSQQGKKTSTLLHAIDLLLQDPCLCHKILESPSIHLDANNLLPAILLIFEQKKLSSFNYIAYNSKLSSPNLPLPLILYTLKKSQSSTLIKYLLPSSHSPYLDIGLASEPILTIDYTGKSTKEVQEMIKITLAINLKLLLEHFRGKATKL